MANNIEQFKEYIKTMSPDFPKSDASRNSDKFYVIELMRRGKDNPGLPAANYHFKSYQIYSFDDFDKFIPEIMQLCDIMRMRAYASVNWKSTRQITLNTIAAMATRVAKGDFKKIYSEWTSQTGLYSHRNENVWILDCDDISPSSQEIAALVDMANSCKSQFERNVIDVFPTRSGSHIITRPFDVKEFSSKIEANPSVLSSLKEFDITKGGELIDWLNNSLIHKNHVTLLYENL